jgi:hypothetical protein
LPTTIRLVGARCAPPVEKHKQINGSPNMLTQLPHHGIILSNNRIPIKEPH